MIYFINFGMPAHKSGIEHAQLKRLKLFEQYKEPCCLIVRDWDRTLHLTAKQSGVKDEQLLSMFDHFQEARHFAPKQLSVWDLDFGLKNLSISEQEEQTRYLVTRANGRLVARVNYDKDRAKQVVSVELFDGYGNLYRVDLYDSRGFCSLRQWYTPDNKIESEEWLTPTGRTVLRTFYKFDLQHNLVKTGWILREADQKVHVFDTLDQLFEYFLNVVNEHGENIFILDRSLLADGALLRLKRPAYTVMHLHNSQAGDAQDPLHSIVNNNYEYALANLDRYSAVVSATKRQTKDVIARFHPQTKCYTIPVGVVPDATLSAPHVLETKRIFGKVIAVARIAPEKQLDDLIKAIALVKKEVPEVTLDLYGYADPSNNYAEKRMLVELISRLELTEVVRFKGYMANLAPVLDQAQIFGLTSRMEGFNLAIMEALSHGVVGVTYDVNYGPNDIVIDQENGAIVPYGDHQALAAAMIKFFKDQTKLQQLSLGAYSSSERYSSANVWRAWQTLLTDAKKYFAQGVGR